MDQGQKTMSKHQCPACGAPTLRVMTAWASQPQGNMPAGYVSYHDADAKIDFWTGRLPVAGYLAPELCSQCDLVSWFVARNLEALPVPADQHDRSELPVVPEPENRVNE
jgi:hypothetical protein